MHHRRRRREAHTMAALAGGQAESEREVSLRLLFDSTHDHQRLAEIRRRLTRSMRQRHEHLLVAQRVLAHVVLHDRVAPRVGVLRSQTLKNPLRRVPLFLGLLLVVFQNGVDHAQPRPQLGPLWGLLPPVARRHCVAQHLTHRFACQPKLQRYCTLALAFDSNCPSYPPIEFHLVHPSGVPRSPPLRQEPAKLRSGGLVLPRRLTPLPRRNAVYFCSGAYTACSTKQAVSHG